MATVFKCDRCGEIFDQPQSPLVDVTIPPAQPDQPGVAKQLCRDKCMVALQNFVKPLPLVAQG